MPQPIAVERPWNDIVADMNALVGEARGVKTQGQTGQAAYEQLASSMTRLTLELASNQDAKNRGVRHDGQYLLDLEVGLIPVSGLGGADHGPC